jgi:hypothetical protein
LLDELSHLRQLHRTEFGELLRQLLGFRALRPRQEEIQHGLVVAVAWIASGLARLRIGFDR